MKSNDCHHGAILPFLAEACFDVSLEQLFVTHDIERESDEHSGLRLFQYFRYNMNTKCQFPSCYNQPFVHQILKQR